MLEVYVAEVVHPYAYAFSGDRKPIRLDLTSDDEVSPGDRIRVFSVFQNDKGVDCARVWVPAPKERL